MSRQLINEYRADLDRLRTVTGSKREGVLSEAFKDLLRRWGKSNDLVFISQHGIVTKKGNRIYTDGALLHSLRVPFGYWEAKDEDDDLEREIEAKFRSGYPRDNIIFSDDRTAILYQDGARVDEAAMDDVDALFALLTLFFAHERQEVADFNKAVKQFATDLPQVLAALREIIAEKRAASRDFASAEDAFLKHARDAINPAVSEDDVQEMLIQHILTEDIFAKVFDNPDFHRQNNVAAALYGLEDKLFDYGEKQKLLKALGPYYAGIQSTAAMIESHSEKQGFLKGLYENFYKVYNPLAADRLGVVYTPGEIVRFMIRSADWLCEKHFGKNLIDKGVEILDPATGTGTFIVELLEHFRGNRDKLAHKYKEELHANEVAILPYYVANLNIEATYAAITGQFAEYPNLCFVDTLDNVAALGIYSGHQGDMFGSVSDENMGRIKRQNERKISVIIGNPPYNANQQNENDNNKNRTYARVDQRIKQTYGARRSSHKTKIYDPFVRFIRWASDRVGSEGNGRGQGIVGFIVNRSFVDKRAFDGFRRSISSEFQAIYVIDLGGDSRDAENAGADVFGNRIGSAILLLVRDPKLTSNSTHIAKLPEGDPEDRVSSLARVHLESHDFALTPLNELGFWEATEDATRANDLRLVPAKLSGSASEKSAKTIFDEASFGFVSNRDDWVIDRVKRDLEVKVAYYLSVYNHVRLALPAKLTEPISAYLDYEIKWTEDLRKYAARRKEILFNNSNIRSILYRPFNRKFHYHTNDVNWSLYQLPKFFPNNLSTNPTIYFSDRGSRATFTALGTDVPAELHLAASTDGFQGVSRYRYTKSGERVDNITDWAVAQFEGHYGTPLPAREGLGVGARVGAPKESSGAAEEGSLRSPPTPNPSLQARGEKDAIFAYCYAVLHDPLYREKYALNLKREFPRIPFYADFAQWVQWGEALLKLHIDYEKQSPFKLARVDTPNPKRAKGTHPKPKLKSDAVAGVVIIDEDTQLAGIPPEAWTYRLGNRSAIDWVLDQHKEKTPRDPTIRARFNTYRFADHKEEMIKLLAKVVTVSLETVNITDAMRALPRSD